MGGALGCPSRAKDRFQNPATSVAEKRTIEFALVDTESSNNKSLTDHQKKLIDYCIEKLNNPEEKESIKDVSIKKIFELGFGLGEFINGEICGLRNQVKSGNDVYDTKKIGNFDKKLQLVDGWEIINGYGMIQNELISSKTKFKVTNGESLPVFYVINCQDRQVSFNGEFESNKSNIYCLKNGEIKYQQGGHYTIITVENGKITSFLDYSKIGEEARELYIDFKESNKSFLKYYQGAQETCYYTGKITQQLNKTLQDPFFEPKGLKLVDDFRESILQILESTDKKDLIKKPKKVEEATGLQNHPKEAAQIAAGESFVKKAINNHKKSLKRRQKTTIAATVTDQQRTIDYTATDDCDPEYHADQVILDFFQNQKKLRESMSQGSTSGSKTVKISQARELVDPAVNTLAKRIVTATMPEMTFAPDVEDSASSSQQVDTSPISFSQQDDIPGSSPTRKLPSFYDEFNKEFLTRILHAVTFFLREEEFEKGGYYESKKDSYYNLLSSVTDSTNFNPISLSELCKELNLTSDQTHKLTARIFEISREKYLPEMQDFAIQMELQMVYQRAFHNYQTANNKYLSGEAASDQITDLLNGI